MLFDDRTRYNPKFDIEPTESDRAIESIKDEIPVWAKYPHRSVQRDEEGNWITPLREELLNNPTIQFSNVLNNLQKNFESLIEILGNLKKWQN